jgi:serine/threonine protein kinase
MVLPAGTRLGQFQVRSLLGKGGHGEVYEVVDTILGRPVVIKILPSELTNKEVNLKRFQREARLASSLDHPNICTVLDMDEVNGVHFVVMQNVKGRNVRELMNGRPLELQSALQITIQVADALAAAHSRGILHRDIKSSNVMVTENGQVKVLDFGIAKLLEEGTDRIEGVSAITKIGVPYGSSSAVAPEQARGERVDQRADIFSTGALLYEMLAGTEPFRGKSSVEVLHALMFDEPDPISKLRGERIPPRLQKVLDRALTKQPSSRYQKMEEFRDALRSVMHEAGADPSVEVETTNVPRHLQPPGAVKRAGRWLRQISRSASPTLAPSLPVDTAPSPRRRHVNAWLVDGQLPLEVGTTYKIGINIGSHRQETVGGGPFGEPQWGAKSHLELLIALNSLDAVVDPEWMTTMLPRQGDMDPVFFHILPRIPGGVTMGLSIYLARDLTLLEKFHLQLPTVKVSAAMQR